jgi:hypothetical protein
MVVALGPLALIYVLSGAIPIFILKKYVKHVISRQDSLRAQISFSSKGEQKKIVGFFHPYW